MAHAETHPRPNPAPPDPPPRGRRSRTSGDAGSFLRMVSHELRTPLNAVIGFSELIGRELHGPVGDPRYAEHARHIHESGLHLLCLVNQVLDLMRLEQGAMELCLRPEPVDEVTAEAASDLARTAEARSVRIVRMLDAEADEVLCDRRGLRTVLVALVANAVAASPAEGVVTLTARREDGCVVLEVRDDGPGLDPADIPRLMMPFEQGEDALVRRSTGAGLGLPMARLLCRAMGGRLHLHSAPGAGVRAAVRLPAPTTA